MSPQDSVASKPERYGVAGTPNIIKKGKLCHEHTHQPISAQQLQL